jgi:dephospho-CoA kinase
MIIVGLTGSIGMGKSTTSGFFRKAGIPVHDADAVVHKLYAGAAAPLIEKAFPGTTKDGVVDRTRLGAAVMADPAAFKTLEGIVHPLVAAARVQFLSDARAKGAAMVVLDIPLLLEGRGSEAVDVIVVASAAADVQRARVLARPGMTEEKFSSLLARQMPDAEKRKRAHLVIDTGLGFAAAERQVQSMIRAFSGSRGRH